MGRKLYRVPLDFNWPLNKVWEGFLNPHYAARVNCVACARSGYAPEAKRISDQWYGIAPFDPVAYGAKPLTIAGSPYLRSKSPEEARRLLAHYKGQWSHHLIQADVDALVAAGRLFDFTRRPRTPEQAAALQSQGGYWMAEWNGYTPTADEINEWVLVLTSCARPAASEPSPVDTPWCFRAQYSQDIGGICFVSEERCNWWRSYVLAQPLRHSKVGTCRHRR